MINIAPSVLMFLNELKNNNNKEWFAAHKVDFEVQEANLKLFFEQIMQGLNETDEIATMKNYRIYRDVRFSKDKSPYKIYRSCSYARATAARRGGYHVEITPGGSFIGVGFWMPEKEDLLRIRQEIDLEPNELSSILNQSVLQECFGGFYEGAVLKTVPKGFDKNHPAVELLKKKDFVLVKKFTDEAVLSSNFYQEVLNAFKIARPFLDYMSMVLTTNLNGETIL